MADIGTKQGIRRQIREIIRSKTPQELSSLSDAVCRKAHHTVTAYNRQQMTILLYWSLPDEVQTPSLVERLHQEGHTVLLPVVVDDILQLRIYQGIDKMQAGPFGILEPQGETFTDYSSIDLAFIPGRAFTTDGKRLGRGKGYYDRLLPLINSPKIGVGFPFQIVEHLPVEPHDVLLDKVIS